MKRCLRLLLCLPLLATAACAADPVARPTPAPAPRAVQVRGPLSDGEITRGPGPVYFVDGVQVASVDDLDPADIVSVEVIKNIDESNSGAARGVVFITTTRGGAAAAEGESNTKPTQPPREPIHR